MRRFSIPLVGFAIALVALSVWLSLPERREHPAAPEVIPANSIFHKPRAADCPRGTKLLPGFFTETNSTKNDACQNPAGDGSIDYLNPGEGFRTSFEF